ncbi:OmpA family protein [Flavobacterium sp.]|uniref:OmpA family protein n=1 Tax=Flavobacterium sp. TaxID=239 RepID=UPI0039E599FD
MKFATLILFCLTFFGLSAQEQFAVFFDSNKFELKKSENDKFQAWMKQYPDVKIVAINGYTDEDGTTGFNDTLAQRRVQTIFRAINGKIKIRDDFKTRSFGEQHNLSKNKAENRKVTIYYILAKDLPRENEILGIKPEPVKPAEPEPKKEIKYPERIVLENPDGTKAEYQLDVHFMKQIGEAKVGEKLKIENLNFVINTFAVVPESRRKLYELLIVMEMNPKLVIEIQGHLCCMPSDKQDLSTKRAKAVQQFLVKNGIANDRITYKGFGSAQPIYPIPEKDEPQRAANRRVEIAIVSN